MKNLSGLLTLILVLGGCITQAQTLVENSVFPNVSVAISQTAQNNFTPVRRIGSGLQQAIGQSFTPAGSLSLRAITFQQKGNHTIGSGAGVGQVELWVGEYDSSNPADHVIGSTLYSGTVDFSNETFGDQGYYTINLPSNVVLSAGVEYAFELNFNSNDDQNFIETYRYFDSPSGSGTDQYPAGGILYRANNWPGATDFSNPWESLLQTGEIGSEPDNDMVFALHTAVVPTIAGLTLNPNPLALLHPLADNTSTGAVSAVFTATGNMDVSMSIGSESHSGAFSIVGSANRTLTNGWPVSNPLEFAFDNTVANLAGGEVSTATVTIVWEDTGSASNGVELLELSASLAYGSLTPVGTNYPGENVVVGADVYDNASVWFRRKTNDLNPPNLLFSQELGQAFTLTQPSLLTDLVLFATGGINATNPSNNLIQVWIGEYKGSTPGATYVDTLIDMTGNPIAGGQFVEIDFEDTWFPAGTYAFQMAWQVADDSHQTTFGRGTTDVTPGGGFIYLPNAPLPLPDSKGQQPYDLVFALRGTPSLIWRYMDTEAPQHNLVITQLVGGVNGFPVRNQVGTTQCGGQSFTLAQETTLSALTLKYQSNKAWDTNTHRMKLWIGDYTTNATGIIPATTYVEELIDVTDRTWNNSNPLGEYFTFDFTDTVFPAGEYAFQVGWEGELNADSIAVFERSGTDEYAGGNRLWNGAAGSVPVAMGNIPAHDQVFILHDASYGTVIETGTAFPTDNVVVGNSVAGPGPGDRGVTWFRTAPVYNNQYAGQSFNLAQETEIGAITLHSWGNATFDGGPQHKLDVVIGSYDPFGSGDGTFQTVYVRDTLDVANMTFTSNAFYKIDFTDVTLPAGDYAVELTWRSPDPGHLLLWKKSDTNPYLLGGWLFINNANPNRTIHVPFNAVEQPTDLVFAVHEAVPVVPQPVLTISESGGTVTVSWTPAGGTLQSTTDLTTTPGSWSDVGAANPYVTPATGAPVYYRVVVP